MIQLKRQRSTKNVQVIKAINKISNLTECEKYFKEVGKCNDLIVVSIKSTGAIKKEI